MKQKKLIFNFFVNRNWEKLTDSRKRAKILADNRKSHHPIETLIEDKAFFIVKMTGPAGSSDFWKAPYVERVLVPQQIYRFNNPVIIN